jgi:hypothetical protein
MFWPLCNAFTACAEAVDCAFTSDTNWPSIEAKELLEGCVPVIGWLGTSTGAASSLGIWMPVVGSGLASGDIASTFGIIGIMLDKFGEIAGMGDMGVCFKRG